jgi:hypothetical protein
LEIVERRVWPNKFCDPIDLCVCFFPHFRGSSCFLLFYSQLEITKQ